MGVEPGASGLGSAYGEGPAERFGLCPAGTAHSPVDKSRTRWPRSDGLCHHEAMAKTVIVKLTDDIDGGDADETVHFALDGTVYEIDLSTANGARLRQAFEPFIREGPGGPRSAGAGVTSGGDDPRRADPVLTVEDEEKARFRAWANMATARRISDARVKEWIAAGRP